MPENVELSERELEILKLIATGASNKEIAKQLFISANTVKVHLRNIFSKIGATTRTEAAMYAVQIGLVQAAPAIGGENGSQIVTDEEEGSELAGSLLPEPAPEVQSRWRRYPGWIALGAIVVLALVVVWVVAAREPAAPAASAPVTPAVEARWQVRASLPSPRAGLAVAAFEDDLYAIGGEDSQGVTDSLWRYNAEQDAWETGKRKLTPVADVGAVAIGGKIYVPGGRLASGEMTSMLEIYDPEADTWDQGASLPQALSGYALAALEGKLYLFGGWDGAKALDTVYQYDPGSDQWSEMTPMLAARAYPGAVTVNGRIYVLGGFDGQVALASGEIYQPSREGGSEPPWTETQPMPEGRYKMGVASVVDNIYVIGGTSTQEGAESLQYLPDAETWQAFDLPVSGSWSRMGMVLFGSHLYLLGGEISGEATDQNLAYQAIYTVSIPSIIK